MYILYLQYISLWTNHILNTLTHVARDRHIGQHTTIPVYPSPQGQSPFSYQPGPICFPLPCNTVATLRRTVLLVTGSSGCIYTWFQWQEIFQHNTKISWRSIWIALSLLCLHSFVLSVSERLRWKQEMLCIRCWKSPSGQNQKGHKGVKCIVHIYKHKRN